MNGVVMEPRLSAITLGVADLDASVVFYSSLGLFPTRTHPGAVAFIQLNGLVLSLYTSLAEDAGVGERTAGLSALAYNVREHAQVDATLEDAAAAGGTITQPARDTTWGGRSGYFADPDGHLWEVAWNPFWPIDEAGNTHYAEA